MKYEGDNMSTEVNQVVLKAVQHFAPLPDTSLPFVLVSLSFVAVIDLHAKINQFNFKLDSVGGNWMA